MLVAQGKSDHYVAEALGYTSARIYQLKKDPSFKELVAYYEDQIDLHEKSLKDRKSLKELIVYYRAGGVYTETPDRREARATDAVPNANPPSREALRRVRHCKALLLALERDANEVAAICGTTTADVERLLRDRSFNKLMAHYQAGGIYIETYWSEARAIDARLSIDWSYSPDVESVPDQSGGAWVVKGTDVLVQDILDNFRDECSVEEIAREIYNLPVDLVLRVLHFELVERARAILLLRCGRRGFSRAENLYDAALQCQLIELDRA